MKVRKGGGKEIPLVQGKEQWLCFAGAAMKRYPTPLSPRPMAAAGRSNPMSKEQRLRRRRRAQGSYPTFKVRKGGGEEIPLVQGKEQWLRFAGAAVKRYPTPKVRETQVRQ